jgi:exodeoxyribonuclease-3
MRIATWNINSIRLRIQLVIDFIREHDIDVLCLQETKTEDQHFPAATFAEAGWSYQAIRGEKSYNGVAILARKPISRIAHREWAGKADCRHISVVTADGVQIENFYVPAGGDIADPKENPKFAHKLQFIDEMKQHFLAYPPRRQILVGDLNIAPLAEDVWSSKQLLRVVSHTPVETDALKALIAECGWHDAVRGHCGADARLYSWWSYRARDWAASDRGRRLDHIWVSHDLADAVQDVSIHRALRGVEKPSDHVPVVISI